MKVSIFTTGSETVENDNGEIVFRDYFGGTFETVSNIVDSIENKAEVDLHILSEQFGYVRGDELVSNAGQLREHADSRISSELVSASEASGVIVLLLTTNTYFRVVEPVWYEMIDNSHDEQLWCISMAPSLLEVLHVEKLSGGKLIYERKGVRRLDHDTTNELINRIVSE